MTASTKRRKRNFTSSSSDGYYTRPTLGEVKKLDCTVSPTQVTVSEGHQWQLLGRTDRDIGGNFSTVDYRYTENGVKMEPGMASNDACRKTFHLQNGTTGVLHMTYDGPLAAQSGFNDFAVINPPTNNQLDAWGTTAIANTIPTRSDASLAVFLGELKEGLPSLVGAQLWKSKARDIRATGSEYLNVSFGWIPLISDIRKFAKAIANADEILAQLERDSGKNVRRTFNFHDLNETTTSVVAGYPTHAGTLTSYLVGSGSRTTVTNRKVRKKFHGCYTYYLSDETRGRIRETAEKARHLLGLELTPETLWELAPWSWLVDYFGNVGDVMTNISAFAKDDLMLRYGYLTYNEVVRKEVTWTGTVRVNSVWTPLTLTSVLETELKMRRKATPYGFGLNTDAFSVRQWANIVALGIARAPRLL